MREEALHFGFLKKTRGSLCLLATLARYVTETERVYFETLALYHYIFSIDSKQCIKFVR